MKKILIIIILSIILNSCVINENKATEPTNENIIIGTWINYNEIYEIITTSENYKSLENEILNIIISLKQQKINTIFLHVRAFDDAFYKSIIFPKSKYCPDKHFEYDILDIFVKICHRNNIYLHAWINPYRLQSSNYSCNTFATDLLNNNPEHIIKSENVWYYNPASPIVQKHIISGIKEIIENYDVDGIHFDDYFYPQVDFIDYFYKNDSISEKEFRTSAVNSLISAVYKTIKSYNDKLIFSISPSGDINKNINECYADVLHWCKNDGYIDYIIPQIYYGFEHEIFPFKETVLEWIDLVNDKTKLIIGLAAYKIGEEDKYAGSGIKEWINDSNVILKQIEFLNSSGIHSYSFYSASHLYSKKI